MLQDQLVEDSLHAGLSTAPHRRVDVIKDDNMERLCAFQVLISMRNFAIYTHNWRVIECILLAAVVVGEKNASNYNKANTEWDSI